MRFSPATLFHQRTLVFLGQARKRPSSWGWMCCSARLGSCYLRCMHEPSPLDALAMLAALDDPVRRTLYRFARQQGRPVTREEAAAEAGISRKLAAFHLDKLVDVGLLDARYQAPPDRRQRVGRAPKVYQPSAVEVRVSIP